MHHGVPGESLRRKERVAPAKKNILPGSCNESKTEFSNIAYTNQKGLKIPQNERVGRSREHKIRISENFREKEKREVFSDTVKAPRRPGAFVDMLDVCKTEAKMSVVGKRD